MNQLTVIDKYAARLLMISFFLPLALQVTAVILSGVYFGFRTFQSGQKIPRSNFVWALVLGSGFLLYILSIPLTPEIFQARLRFVYGNKMSFFIMPFLFAVITPGFGAVIKRELPWFVYGCIITCLYANLMILTHYASLIGGLHALTHVGYRVGFQDYVNVHPTYMAMYLCFSICILLYSDQFQSRSAVIAKYIMLYLLLMFFMALLAKAPLIALIIIFIHYAIVHRRNLYRYKSLFMGVIIAVAAAWLFIPFVGQRVNEMVQIAGGNKAATVTDNSISARKLIWHTDVTLLKHYWLTGVGPGRVYQSFQERYLFYSLINGPVGAIHDPHNEYINEWLSFGILGLVVFAGIFIAYLVKAIRSRDHLYLYLLIILYITFFTETVLSTQRGLMFYAVFAALMFYSKPTKEISA